MKRSMTSSAVSRAIAVRRDRVRELDAEHARLIGERTALLSAPVSVDEARQFVSDYIDACAAEYPRLANWSDLFAQLLYPRRYADLAIPLDQGTPKRTPLCLRDIDDALRNPPGSNTFRDGLRFFGAGSGVNTHGDFGAFFFFGDLIKRKVLERFDEFATEFAAEPREPAAPGIAARRQRIADIDARVAEIDAERASIQAEFDAFSRAVEKVDITESPETREPRYPDDVRDRKILREFNGVNMDDLARKYAVSVPHVARIVYYINSTEQSSQQQQRSSGE